MQEFVGTPSCPHLGFDLQGGRPCCHADDQTRVQCGKFAPNPAARGAAGNTLGVEPFFCTVLGTDTIPAAALKLAAQQKSQASRQAREAGQQPYRPPSEVRGQLDPRPDREQAFDDERDPVIPTHTIRADDKKVMPNAPCPCGSGRKYKKCCGRNG